MVKTINEANFEAEVLNSAKPVMIDFYADWCGPCKMMSPMVDALAEAYADQLVVGKINADDNGELAAAYNVMSIPNIKFFKDGKVVDEVVGAQPKEVLEGKINALL